MVASFVVVASLVIAASWAVVHTWVTAASLVAVHTWVVASLATIASLAIGNPSVATSLVVASWAAVHTWVIASWVISNPSNPSLVIGSPFMDTFVDVTSSTTTSTIQ